MNSLIQRVKNATSSYGSKAQLASAIGVPRQRINDWLSGCRAPGGEYTLKLLEWVTEAEAKQQKAPGDVISIAKGEKTRKRKSSNENLKSGP